MIQYNELNMCLNQLEYKLVNSSHERGFWKGSLSSSALSTSAALFALSMSDKQKYHSLTEQGIKWLHTYQNNDGGWGDSPQCPSNLSTTLLTWAAFSLSAKNREKEECNLRAETWLREKIGSLKPTDIASAVLNFYGNDKTFSAPILACCALAGKLGNDRDCWQRVPQLPMELAIFPHAWFQFLKLPVVSYALPALISIGLVRHNNHPSSWPWMKILRDWVTSKLLKKLKKMQPINGGYLEASPLTAFVTISLIGAGFTDHSVVESGINFLIQSQRSDGSWPIDTDLATWITTLSIKAVAVDSNGYLPFTEQHREKLTGWLLAQQFNDTHPFTHSPPGGWSWTHHPGAVPDADDTSGVLLALYHLGDKKRETLVAVQKGIQWLLDLQNKDGGIPTFCRGWGKLPFDQSCPDITAHAISAWLSWQSMMPETMMLKIERSINKAVIYLLESQREDGSWLPLWFGNPWSSSAENPVYGTTQVLKALQNKNLRKWKTVQESLQKSCHYLTGIQNADGGWGSAKGVSSSIEETSMILEVLTGKTDDYIILGGLNWLIQEIHNQKELPASPIGLYFANLWYAEKMYPLIFSIAALRRMKFILKKYPAERNQNTFQSTLIPQNENEKKVLVQT